jgi:hypothetical protein
MPLLIWRGSRPARSFRRDTITGDPVMSAETAVPASQRRLGLAWGLLAWVLILSAGVYAAEWILRSRYLRIAGSDRLTAGMAVPDPTLGWRLRPSWRGRHAHHDFDVSYSINPSGFRGADPRDHRPPARQVAFVGDSFTFGIGVLDGETFTELMDRRQPAARRVYNYSVPGFATDQEVLLAERFVFSTRPDVLVLVTYLANDLFDNQLAMPLQVRRSKPLFALTGANTLALKNPPAAAPPDSRAGQPMLIDMVLGNRAEEASLRQRLEARSYLFRLLSEKVLPGPADDPAFDRRHDYALRLYWALIERLQQGCRANGVRCVVALMPGSSLVDSPSSLSAQFQDFFRRRLVEEGARRQIDVIDVARELRARYAQSPGQWFHPNEGHLSAEGHRVVAAILDEGLDRITAGK